MRENAVQRSNSYLYDQYQFKLVYIHVEIQIEIDLKDTNSNFVIMPTIFNHILIEIAMHH
jgi:hypothetical protein